MPANVHRPSYIERREDGEWIVYSEGGTPLRYYSTEEEARAFIDGFNYGQDNDT